MKAPEKVKTTTLTPATTDKHQQSVSTLEEMQQSITRVALAGEQASKDVSTLVKSISKLLGSLSQEKTNAQLTNARAITVNIDTVQDWLPDIRLSAGDIEGRIIRATITNDMQPIPATGLTARMLFNTRPDDPESTGGYVTMTAASHNNAIFEVPVPRAALTSDTCKMSIEITDTDGGIVCARSFDAIIEPSILNVNNPQGQDALKELHDGIANVETSLKAAQQATQSATQAASKADASANAASNAASKADTASSKATQAASKADASANAASNAASKADTSATNADQATDRAIRAAEKAEKAAKAGVATDDTAGIVKPGKGLRVDNAGTLSVEGLPVYYTDGDIGNWKSPSTPCVVMGPRIGVVYDDGR